MHVWLTLASVSHIINDPGRINVTHTSSQCTTPTGYMILSVSIIVLVVTFILKIVKVSAGRHGVLMTTELS
jgi:hypothetical protein